MNEDIYDPRLYTPQQRKALEDHFSSLKPGEIDSRKKLEEISEATGLQVDTIQMWLQQRRTRGVSASKGRTVHNVHQVRALEWVFTNYSQYPSTQLKKKLAEYLYLSYAQLQKWFQTRRQRGTPALLSHRALIESEWEKSLKEIRQIIKEAVEEEYQDISEVPSKKRKLDDSMELVSKASSSLLSITKAATSLSTPSVSVETPSPKSSSSPDFSPAPKFPSTANVRPQIPANTKPPVEPLLGPPSVPSTKNGSTRLPSLREIFKEPMFYHPQYDPSYNIAPYYPFGSSQPIPPQYPQSNGFFRSDEKSVILPPLPSVRQVSGYVLPPLNFPVHPQEGGVFWQSQ
jgi:hypothetical protein